MTDENVQSLLEALLLGTLKPAEAQELQRRLETGDPIVTAACQEARRLLVALPNALQQTAPPAELRERILQAAVQDGNQAAQTAKAPATMRAMPQRTLFQTVTRSLAWAAALLLVTLGYAYYHRSQEVAALHQQLQERQQEIEGLKLSLAFHRDMAKALQKPRSLLVDLKAIKEAPATGKVIVDRENARAYFVAATLPVLEANKDYQLWYIGKSGPVDAGVFQVDANGYGGIQIRNLPQDLSEIAAFAVTIEPKGGSVNPTLDQMVLLGRV